MILRPVTSEDAKSLVRLIKQLGYNPTESELLQTIEAYNQSDHSWSYAIAVDEVVVACASYHLVPYFHCKGALMRVTSLVVDSDFKRKGFGKVLLDQAGILARENGCDKVELTTGGHRKNEAHLFYEALGYKPYDGVRYLKGIDAWIN